MSWSEEELTIGARVIMHLSRCSRQEHHAVYPVEMTQDGIAEEMGIGTGSVSVHLRRLIESGCVVYKTEHVKDARTRRKVYFTTPKGDMIAEYYREERRGSGDGGDEPSEDPGESATPGGRRRA